MMDSTKTRSSRITLLIVCFAMAIARPSFADDVLDAYRERFQQGLDRYRAGDVLGAAEYWEAIRRELGDEVAYRLLFNLGKAYEALGDATLAAERYEAFLALYERQDPQTIEPSVRENAETAKERIQHLNTTRGRIRILPSERPGLVQVDLGQARLGPFRTYVAPGKHTITIDRGTSLERTIDVALEAGQEFVVDPSRPKPKSVAPPAPVPSVPAPREPPAAPAPVEPSRPFPSYVLYVSAGATVASLAVPWLTYRHADGIADEYEDPNTGLARRRELADDYDSAKDIYHVSWALPVLLASTTGVLTLWYLGSEGPSEPGVRVGAAPFGAGMRITGSF